MNKHPSDLGSKTAKGAVWLTAGQVLAGGLGSLRLVVFAAILPQDQLGLFGIAYVIIRMTETFSNTGMRQALIQRSGDVKSFLGTAWVTEAVRSAAIGVAIFSISGFAERFFDKPGLAHLLQLLALVPAIKGLYNMGIVHLHREFQFGKVVVIRITFTLVDLTCSVAYALVSPTAMALVVGKICGATAGVCLSFLIEKRRAPLEFQFDRLLVMYRFGFWVFVSAVLSFVLVSGGDFVIGKLLPMKDLAIYQVAYGLACMPIMQVIGVVGVTTFSAYSRIQGEPDRLRTAFLRVFCLSSIVIVYSVVGAVVLAQDFTRQFFRPEYAPVATLLPPLAIWALVVHWVPPTVFSSSRLGVRNLRRYSNWLC